MLYKWPYLQQVLISLLQIRLLLLMFNILSSQGGIACIDSAWLSLNYSSNVHIGWHSNIQTFLIVAIQFLFLEFLNRGQFCLKILPRKGRLLIQLTSRSEVFRVSGVFIEFEFESNKICEDVSPRNKDGYFQCA